MVGSYGFEHSENAHSIDICRKLWGIEADLNVALSCQIVYLCRLHQADQLDEGHRVAHVGIVKMEMRLAFQMSDAFAEVNRGTANDAMHLVTFLQQELAQV